MAELVIRCLEKDLALSQELVADLAAECLLVRFHRQQEVGQLFLELLLLPLGLLKQLLGRLVLVVQGRLLLPLPLILLPAGIDYMNTILR